MYLKLFLLLIILFLSIHTDLSGCRTSVFAPSVSDIVQYIVLHCVPNSPDTSRGNKGDCLHAPLSLPWCPLNAPFKIYNFLIGCPLPIRKCLGALALSKTKHTGLRVQKQKIVIPYIVYMFVFSVYMNNLSE